MEPPFVSSISAPLTITKDTPVTLQLSGNWPNPSWQHAKTSIDVDPETRELVVSYLGQSGGGLVIQVLEPVEASIEASFPSSGTWTIIARGRSGPVQTTIEVTG